MVGVRVAFRANGQEWTHNFHVEGGNNILKLKEVMLSQEKFTKEDVNSFELQRDGRRVNDYEALWEDATLQWRWLGPEDGAVAAAADESEMRKACEEAMRREARDRAVQRATEEAQRQRSAAQEAERQARSRPAQMVDVVVKHAMKELESQVTVSVMDNCTIGDVRRAVMELLGETQSSQVKLVKKAGNSGFASCLDSDPLGNRRELASMGRKLVAAEQTAGQPAPESLSKDVEFKIRSAEDQAELSLLMAPSGQVWDLKVAICRRLPRATPDRVRLSTPHKPLRDSDSLRALSAEDAQSLLLRGMGLSEPRHVKVAVKHGFTGHAVEVEVLETATVLEVRQAAADRIGWATIADIKMMSASDKDYLNGRKEFLCTGRALERSPPPPPKPAALAGLELNITVFLDRGLDFKTEATVQAGSSVRQLKELLASFDPTGDTAAESFGLRLPSPEGAGAGAPLPGDLPLTSEHLELEVCAPDAPIEVALVHAVDGSSLAVTVPQGSRVLDVRQAAMQAIGQTKMSELKVYRMVGSELEAVPNDEAVGSAGTLTLYTTGCTLR